MNKFVLTIVVLFFGLPLFIFAQNINGRFSSSIYTFERFDTTDASNNYIRAYQLLNLNVNKNKFSLRTYLNLENDLSQNMDYDPRLRFYNLYFEARDILSFATIKLGRQPIINTVSSGVMDGISLNLRSGKFKLSGYYGGNVPAYQKLEMTNDLENDYLLGGKLSTTAVKNFQIGIGYVNKNFKPYDFTTRFDENLNPLNTLIEARSNQFEFVTGEVFYDLKNVLNAGFKYEYDLNFEETSMIEFNSRYEQIKDLGLNVYYQFREPKIRYNSIFSVFNYGNSQEIEFGTDYKIMKNLTAVAKYGVVTYESENSSRLTVGLNTGFGSLNYRKTLGYAGELDAISIYSAHSFMEGLFTPSLGLSYTSYKLSQDSEKNNLASVLAGLNYRPLRMLSFDLQGQYLSNKIYKNDFRVFFKLNYWFNTNLNLL